MRRGSTSLEIPHAKQHENWVDGSEKEGNLGGNTGLNAESRPAPASETVWSESPSTIASGHERR